MMMVVYDALKSKFTICYFGKLTMEVSKCTYYGRVTALLAPQVVLSLSGEDNVYVESNTCSEECNWIATIEYDSRRCAKLLMEWTIVTI